MILKIKTWSIAFVLVFTIAIVFLGQKITISANNSYPSIENIPMPQVEQPLRILTPANEIFNIASCKVNDLGFTIAQADIPPGAGPIPHVHYYIDEWFWTPKAGLELFHSTRQYPTIKEVPNIAGAGRADMYSIISQANQIIYSPNFYVHGFVNPTTETLPITFVWLKNDLAPVFPHDDGGMRDFFTEVGVKITDLNNLPSLNDKNKNAVVTEAPRYGMNQSSYFMEYVNSIDNQFPEELAKMQNDEDLKRVIEAVEAFNSGDKSVSCS
jgi:oxalate decarboxylase/phosphoglucose isomerase-like protein (cupin superfamily)